MDIRDPGRDEGRGGKGEGVVGRKEDGGPVVRRGRARGADAASGAVDARERLCRGMCVVCGARYMDG